jgi:LmbE family N-acetylglucosaminyl deacetylase
VSQGNGGRLAGAPVAGGGTPQTSWLAARLGPDADLTGCTGLVAVGAHPDDETLGLGATIAGLAAAGVGVQVVSVSDGGAADPGASPSERMRLEARRRRELLDAAEVLGIGPPRSFGLPDGRLAEYEGRITQLLVEILAAAAPGTWCAATWRGDGHPDHEAVGRAAAVACARTGVPLVEYPIWMWHWAVPGDSAVPWHRAYSMPRSVSAADRKRRAVQCFRSQLESPSTGGPPVLPAFVVDRLVAVGEVVFR